MSLGDFGELGDPIPKPSDDLPETEATLELLARAQGGDAEALNRLLERVVPRLRRWAHGRLPRRGRDVHDTSDIVQEVIIGALRNLDGFKARHEGALQAYLRQAVVRRIMDIERHRRRRPESTDVPRDLPAHGGSPLDQAIGQQNMARYEAALQRLVPEDREAIVARLELQYSYEDLRVVLAKPTANAARSAVVRALRRLAAEMRKEPR